MNTFTLFSEGRLVLPDKEVEFDKLPWNPHPSFQGVELKHLVKGEDTKGAFSYHLVKIAPRCSIEKHIHETQLETHEIIAGEGICDIKGTALTYMPGHLSIIEAGIEHSVTAGEKGLYLFAKFMPALC